MNHIISCIGVRPLSVDTKERFDKMCDCMNAMYSYDIITKDTSRITPEVKERHKLFVKYLLQKLEKERQGVDGSCNTNKESSDAAKITAYEDVPANNMPALLKAVVNQPVLSMAIDASGSDFQFYPSKVFTGECRNNLDHGLTIIRYDVDSDGTKYWLVKNSWGASWRESEYIRMQKAIRVAKGLSSIANECFLSNCLKCCSK